MSFILYYTFAELLLKMFLIIWLWNWDYPVPKWDKYNLCKDLWPKEVDRFTQAIMAMILIIAPIFVICASVNYIVWAINLNRK